MPFDLKLLLPGQDRVRDELGAVVSDDHARATPALDDLAKLTNDVTRIEFHLDLGRFAFRNETGSARSCRLLFFDKLPTISAHPSRSAASARRSPAWVRRSASCFRWVTSRLPDHQRRQEFAAQNRPQGFNMPPPSRVHRQRGYPALPARAFCICNMLGIDLDATRRERSCSA